MLFGQQPHKQYLTVSLQVSEVLEKVHLRFGNQQIDISRRQFCLCQDPFLVGVCLSKEEAASRTDDCILEIIKSDKTLVRANCKFNESIDLGEVQLLLLAPSRKSYPSLNKWKQKALVAYFYYHQRHKVSFSELDNFSAMYSYPRPVVITCFGTEADYNVFPMDLQGPVPGGEYHLLGLRNTNLTLKKMLAAKKVLICGIDAKHKKTIFKLGAHHSKEPPPISELPFRVLESKNFGYIYPEIVEGYKELEIIDSYDKGSHTIMVCRVVHNASPTEQFSSLHHLHISSPVALGTGYKLV